MLRKTLVTSLVILISLVTTSVYARDITIGYQPIYNPWKVAIADGAFEAATGKKIKWIKYDSGSKVINAMASGKVDIAMAGSSPIAAAVSLGIPMELFWITEDIASAEALVVRDGSGVDVNDPKTLIGKSLGVPFVSTTHFHTLFALELWGIEPKELDIINMQPGDIETAWERGDIDAGFIWDPVLGKIKASGEVMITSGELSARGKATFDGMVVMKAFAKANPDIMVQFVKVIATADQAYRNDSGAFQPGSENAEKIADLVDGNEAEVAGVLELYQFPTLDQQASAAWLGGGKDGGAARALFYTSKFLQDEGRVDRVHDDYSKFVNPAFVRAAVKAMM
ncbi:MAG: taurine ABC transporter substrate-binding protein [Geminicoccaceae bacterium]